MFPPLLLILLKKLYTIPTIVVDGISNAGDRSTDLEKVEKDGAVLPSSVGKASILSFDKLDFSGMNVVDASAKSSLELAASLENMLAHLYLGITR